MLISTSGIAIEIRRARCWPMTGVRQALGAWGERTAEAYLRVGGITVIDRNWRRRGGEIDLIAMDGETLVFCEQKFQDLRHVKPARRAFLGQHIPG